MDDNYADTDSMIDCKHESKLRRGFTYKDEEGAWHSGWWCHGCGEELSNEIQG